MQSYCEDAGFSVVREFVGHGTGRELHEDPEVPNYGHQGRGPRLVPGMQVDGEYIDLSKKKDLNITALL